MVNTKHILNIQTEFLMKLLPGDVGLYLGYTLTMLKERKDHTGAPDVGL